MPRKVEPLNGGLVTNRDPALLSPGQLSDMRNMVYRPPDQRLWRAFGRALFGRASATATAVYGLRDVQFDNSDQYLIAAAGTKLRSAPIGATGTFSDLATVTQGTTLEAVQYRNRFFLMNGASSDASAIGSNVVAYLSATATGTSISTRQHGMLPVIAAPNVVTGSGAFSQTVTGYYEYWTTEVVKLTQDGASLTLESAYSNVNGVSTVFVSSTAVQPTIQQPTVRNATTTHWRIYRSPKKSAQSDKEFPTGFMIAELATAASAHADTTAVASASSFPSAFNTATGIGHYFHDFASASAMASSDGVFASATTSLVLTESQQGVYGFNLGGFSGSVKGVIIEVKAYVSSGSQPVPLQVSIGKRDAASGNFVGASWVDPLAGDIFHQRYVASKSAQITATASAGQVITVGASADRWFATDLPGLVDTDFDATFMVVLDVSKTSVSVGVDYVKATVFYSGSVDSTVVYPTVVYTFGDITSQVSKNFPPPSSSTGDMFQDSLVVNDVSNKSLVRYSFPGDPEVFPPTYFLDFETRENDTVQCIRTCNNRLIVGLDNSLWRVNYLPSERDSSFDRGRAIEKISNCYGIVGPMVACTFTMDGQNEMLAFVSHKGLHTTDGFNCTTRSDNQDWRTIISLASTSNAIALVNDPENMELLLFYRNDSLGNETYMCLHASYYGPDIDEGGNFKFSGPVHMRNFDSGSGAYASLESAWAAPRNDGSTGIYLGYGGTATAAGAGAVYFETGTTIPANDSTCQYTTRRMYQAGMSGEWMLEELYGYCGSYTGAPILTYTFKGTKTNDTGETSRGTKTITLAGAPLHKMSPKIQNEGLRINMQATASSLGTEMLVICGSGFGLEDSGR